MGNRLFRYNLGGCVAGGFWAVILSQAAWKRSWVGCDPAHSIMMVDRSVAITGDTARAQILTAKTTGPDRDICHRPLTTIINIQAN